MVLSRRHLAEQLRISVPPVTEAMQHLENEGLLESRPRAGTRVRIPTREDIEGHAVVREALEVQSARLFTERATATEKKDLRQRGRQMDRLYACCETGEVDRELLFSANTFHLGFHLRIAECGRVPALRAAIEKAQVLEFNSFYDTAVGRRSLGGNYHTVLADALATGTTEQAGEAMRAHIRSGLGEVLERLDTLPRQAVGWRRRREA
jgi:DNA-binding GntR family transcriptional regulator